jgi:hypothetical protein
MSALLLALQLTAAATAPTVFVFTTTDCPISNRYAPEIKRLSAKFAGKVRIVLVYPVPADSDAMIREHVRKFGYTNEWRRDPDQRLVKHTGVTVTPEVAVVDKDQRVLYRGRIDDRYVEFGRDRPEPTVRDLDRSLDAILAGRAAPVRETQAVGCILSDLVK